MPARNSIKEYVPESFYHVYNRGVEKRKIFVDDADYKVFLNLLKRYLSKETSKDKFGRDGKTFYGDMELLAFCLMPNHFHFLIYVNDEPRAMSNMISRVCTAYTMYFNKRYKRVGHLFQGRFKASRITTDEYLVHISRYIHLNPKEYLDWPYSSLPYYMKDWVAEWVRPGKITSLYEPGTYGKFLADYEGHKAMIEEIKYELADK